MPAICTLVAHPDMMVEHPSLGIDMVGLRLPAASLPLAVLLRPLFGGGRRISRLKFRSSGAGFDAGEVGGQLLRQLGNFEIAFRGGVSQPLTVLPDEPWTARSPPVRMSTGRRLQVEATTSY